MLPPVANMWRPTGVCSSTNHDDDRDHAEVVAEQRQAEEQPVADLLVALVSSPLIVCSDVKYTKAVMI